MDMETVLDDEEFLRFGNEFCYQYAEGMWDSITNCVILEVSFYHDRSYTIDLKSGCIPGPNTIYAERMQMDPDIFAGFKKRVRNRRTTMKRDKDHFVDWFWITHRYSSRLHSIIMEILTSPKVAGILEPTPEEAERAKIESEKEERLHVLAQAILRADKTGEMQPIHINAAIPAGCLHQTFCTPDDVNSYIYAEEEFRMLSSEEQVASLVRHLQKIVEIWK